MSFDLKFDKLVEAVEWSTKQLDRPRLTRIGSLREFAGYHYGDDQEARTKVPVPMLKLAINVYGRTLAPRSPQALISTRHQGLKATAANLQLAVNQIPAEIQLAKTFRQIVTEALFSIGVARVGLHTTGIVRGYPYGSPFVDCIPIDDYFVDMSAKHRGHIQFEGNDYWLTRDEMEEAGWSKKSLAKLRDDDLGETTIGERGNERAEAISVGGGSVVSYRKRYHLRDVWLPQDELLVTYLVKSKEKLNVIEWEGPDVGPYVVLGFDEVPGNLLPLPPASVWRDLHELSNALFRKLGRQADAQKTVLGFSEGDDEQIRDFKAASDGDGIRYTGAKPERLEAGGVDQKTLAMFLQSKDLFSYFAGNIDALGGLAPQTETLGQDRLLSEAASAHLRDMQSMTVDFARDVFRSLAFYEWNDPVKTRRLEKPIPGMGGMTISVDWNRKSKIGEFDQYDLDIDVYSLIDDSPALKLQRLGFIMQNYISPLAPEIERQGGTIEVQKILEMVGKLADFEEIREFVSFPGVAPSPADGHQAEAPRKTEHVSRRVSQPGATPRGKSDVLQRILLGDNPQDSEAAVLSR